MTPTPHVSCETRAPTGNGTSPGGGADLPASQLSQRPHGGVNGSPKYDSRNARRQSEVSAYARIMSTRERSNERRRSSASAARRTASRGRGETGDGVPSAATRTAPASASRD